MKQCNNCGETEICSKCGGDGWGILRTQRCGVCAGTGTACSCYPGWCPECEGRVYDDPTPCHGLPMARTEPWL